MTVLHQCNGKMGVLILNPTDSPIISNLCSTILCNAFFCFNLPILPILKCTILKLSQKCQVTNTLVNNKFALPAR